MKRKIIYIVLVVLFAIAVSLITNGCDFQPKSEEPTDSGEQEKVVQEVVETSPAGIVTGTDPTIIEPADKESAQQSGNQPLAQKKQVTISVSCATIYDNLDVFDSAKKEILPENGFIIPATKVEIAGDETVFDVLLKVTKDKRIHMEYVSTPIYKSNYIEGIGNIYEIDAGPLSGWMYKVNDWFPNYGCGQYVLKDGDNIEWVYTCDLGRDIGGDWNEQNK